MREVESDPSLPLEEGNRLVHGECLKRSPSIRGTVLCVCGGVTNLQIRVPLNHGSCLLLPALCSGLLWSHLRDLSLHCPQDDSTGEILFDEVFHALSRCLGGLLRPFRVPGSCIDFQPEIYITIQAYSSIIGLQAHQVLLPLLKSIPPDLISESPLIKPLSHLCGLCPESLALLAS